MSEPYVPSLKHPNPPTLVPTGILHVTTTTDPERMAELFKKYAVATFFGIKAFVNGKPTGNTGNVYLGWNATEQPVLIGSGESVTIKSDTFNYNMVEMWVKADSAGDGLYVTFNNP